MCRFILARSREPQDMRPLLREFTRMCEASRTVEGDRQGDGCGVAWTDLEGKWHIVKSLQPIWEDSEVIESITQSRLLVAHARSASFPNHLGNIEFNQPYLADGTVFVFNGDVKGVKIVQPLAGTIGAQKIFSLLQQQRDTYEPVFALREIDEILTKNSQEIVGMNIGMVVDETLYALCRYSKNAQYFTLYSHETADLSLVCSEMLRGYAWKTLSQGEIKVI